MKTELALIKGVTVSTESIISMNRLTSVVATTIGRKGEGKTIAPRADIDALPINEGNQTFEFASENDGSHARTCGT